MRRILAAFLAFALLSGCDTQAWIARFLEPGEIELADKLYDVLKKADADAVRAEMEEVPEGDLEGVLATIANMIPDTEPVRVELLAAHRFASTTGSNSASLVRSYEYDDKWIVLQMSFKPDSEVPRLEGFHINEIWKNEVAANDFTLSGKSTAHYLALFLAVAIPAFILYTFVVCLRSPLTWRWKLLWSIFILIGLTQIVFNWTTGQVSVNILSVQFFGAGFFKPTFQPILLLLSVPLGAIWFWITGGRRENLCSGAQAD